MTTRFWVSGIPVPKGSAKAFFNKGMRFPTVVQANQEKQRPWSSAISEAAAEEFAQVLQGAIALTLEFYLPRPKGHFNKKGLRHDAPFSHLKKPDLDKLVRCVKDALSSVAYADDSQVFSLTASKFYTNPTGKSGVLITVVESSPEQEIL